MKGAGAFEQQVRDLAALIHDDEPWQVSYRDLLILKTLATGSSSNWVSLLGDGKPRWFELWKKKEWRARASIVQELLREIVDEIERGPEKYLESTRMKTSPEDRDRRRDADGMRPGRDLWMRMHERGVGS